MSQPVPDTRHPTVRKSSIPVLDREHFCPQRKNSSVLLQMAAGKPSRIPFLQKSSLRSELNASNPIALLVPNTSNSDTEQSSSQASQIVQSTNWPSDDMANQETSDTPNELSTSLNTAGGRSSDSGFADEKNKQQAEFLAAKELLFTRATVDTKDSDDSEAKCFVPLEEVDQGITRTASQGSLASTIASTTSMSLGEMVGDECSSSGLDYVGMSKVSESDDHSVSAQSNRPRSAYGNFFDHHATSDQQMKRYGSLPQLESSPTLLASKVNLLHSEKETLESELRLCKSRNHLAQSEIKALKEREAQLKTTVSSLEATVSNVNNEMDQLKQSKFLEMNHLKRQMSGEHDKLVNELHTQIRQLTLEREEALAQVSSLHQSLSEAQTVLRETGKKECDEFAASATQVEVDSLQMELKALKAFTAEGESARAALQRNLVKLNKQISDLQSEKSDLLLQLEDKNAVSTNTILAELRAKLARMEEQISAAADDKSRAVAEVEQRLTAEKVKLQLQSEEVIGQLRESLNSNEEAIDVQHQKMVQMEKQLSDTSKPKAMRSPKGLKQINASPEKKVAGGTRRTHKDRSRSPSPPPLNTSFSGPNSSFPSFGRWTAHRAYVKKHAEEMQMIMSSLAKEGFTPGQSSVDEVIRHLWWKREHSIVKLRLAEKTIKGMSGGDAKVALKEWKQNLSKLEAKIESGEEDTEHLQKREQELEQAIERQLQDLILVKQQALDECTVLKQKAETSDQRMFELEERNLAAENDLSKSYKNSVIIQDKLDFVTKQHEACQSELKLEQKQTSLLKTEINTLRCQLEQQKQQLKQYYADRDKTIEKLDQSGADMQQTKQRSSVLEAKVNQLEKDLKAAEQRYSIVNEHKVALEEQLDGMRMQKSTLESILENEKNSKRSIQQELDQLSLEYQQKVQMLNNTNVHENELKIEVLNLQRNLQMTQQHFTESETELAIARMKSSELQNQLAHKESQCEQLTGEVSALSSELESSHAACGTLQMSLSSIQSKLDISSKETEILTVEKEELQTRLNSILNDLDSAHKKLELSGKEKSEHVHVMAIKDQQLLEVESEKSKIFNELRDGKAVAQSMQENLHKIVDEKNAEIFKLKQDNLTTGAELTVAEKKIEIADKEVTKLRSQLEETSESFLKQKKLLNEELSSTTEQISRLSGELIKKDEALTNKDLELAKCKEEINQLMSKISATKTELQQVNLSGGELKSHLATLTEEMDTKSRHIESLENDLQVIRQHIESLNCRVLEQSNSPHSEEEPLAEAEQKSNQMVRLLNTIQQEIHDVSRAKHVLEVQVSSLSEQKQSNEKKVQKLEQEMFSLRTDLSQVTTDKEELSDEANQLRVQLQEEVQTNIENMARSQQDLQKICKDYEHRISEIQSKCLLLESQFGQKESALKIAESETSSLKTRLAMASTDLETTLATNRSLEKVLGEMREAAGQQQSKLMQEVLDQKSSNESLNIEMTSLKSQWTQIKHSSDATKAQLKEEKKQVAKLNSDLQVAMKTSGSLSLQLQSSREECQMLTTNIKELNESINHLKRENVQLQEKLRENMSELSAAHKASSDANKKFTTALATLQSRLGEDKAKADNEKQQLLAEMSQIRNESASQQHSLHQTQQELQQYQLTLERSDRMRSELETTLQSEIKYREDLQARYHNAESEKDHFRIKMEQLKSELNVKEEKCKQKEFQEQKALKDYSGLLEQLQIQREAAAGSLNKLQQKSKEQTTELQTKIDSLNAQLQGVHLSLKNAELSAKSLSSDNSLLSREVVELRTTCNTFKKKLREEESSVKLAQHKIEQLCVNLELQKQHKDKCQEEVNELQALKSSLQSKLIAEKDKTHSSKAEKEALEEILNSERSLIISLKNEISQLKLQLKALNQELEVEKQSHLGTSQNATRELFQLKEKFNEDKKGFKLKIKDLNNRLLELESEIQKKELDLARVKDANYDMTEERVQFTTKLTETERKSRERKDEVQKFKMRNHDLELQVSQLQLEINTLQQMQMEWEHYKKKLEASSRAEVQHVLAEVTEHMAQQHSAHKSLEKLRAENESLALKEKERKIYHLKSELRQAKQGLKHDQLHIDNLELETSLLKSQKKDQERARKRLETKLHTVNSTLTQSLRSPNRSYDRPQAISTPYWNNSLSDINSL